MTSLPCVQHGRDCFFMGWKKAEDLPQPYIPALSGKRNGPGEKRLVNRAVSVCLA